MKNCEGSCKTLTMLESIGRKLENGNWQVRERLHLCSCCATYTRAVLKEQAFYFQSCFISASFQCLFLHLIIYKQKIDNLSNILQSSGQKVEGWMRRENEVKEKVNLCFFLNKMIKRQLNGRPFRMAAP